MLDVVGYEGLYTINEYGVVTTGEGRVLKQHNHKGYSRVNLYFEGKKKNKRVHRLVAEAYIPNPEGLSSVDHIDEDKSNNHVSNLQWLTATANNVRSVPNVPRESTAKPIYLDDVLFDSRYAAAKWLAVTYDKNISTILRDLRSSCRKTIYGHSITRI